MSNRTLAEAQPPHRQKSSDLQRLLFVFTNTRRFISFTELSKSEFHKHSNHTQSPKQLFRPALPHSRACILKSYSTRIGASMFRFLCNKSAIDTLQRNKRVIHICNICCLSNIGIATLDFRLSQLAKVGDRQLVIRFSTRMDISRQDMPRAEWPNMLSRNLKYLVLPLTQFLNP